MTNETRQTKWIAFGHYGYTHYMIEERKLANGVVQQRHSWKSEDGSIRQDEWINTVRRELSLKAA